MTEINDLSSRKAMGLAEGFVAARFDAIPEEALSVSLGVRSTEELNHLRAVLARSTEDPASSLEARLAAGELLALVGDPRVRPLNPTMVHVPAANVWIGTPAEEVDAVFARYAAQGVKWEWIEKECPRHPVPLRSFRLGKYPVTNAEYRAFLLANPERSLPRSWPLGIYPRHWSNHPVHGVSAEDADAYCAWLSQRTSRTFRLPTEAEWEYAAAGSLGFEFPWGDTFESGRANTLESGLLCTTPVGVFPDGASPFGALDMAGNVEEYVATDFARYPSGHAEPDDLEVRFGTYRVARGGSFTRHADLARCRRRHGWFPKEIYVMGFRVAESGGEDATEPSETPSAKDMAKQGMARTSTTHSLQRTAPGSSSRLHREEDASLPAYWTSPFQNSSDPRKARFRDRRMSRA